MNYSRTQCEAKDHNNAIFFFLSDAVGVCVSGNLHGIIFFLLVSLLENKICLGAFKPNYWPR